MLSPELAERGARVKVRMVGKYTDLIDAYKTLNEAHEHAGLHTNTTLISSTLMRRTSKRRELTYWLRSLFWSRWLATAALRANRSG